MVIEAIRKNRKYVCVAEVGLFHTQRQSIAVKIAGWQLERLNDCDVEALATMRYEILIAD